MIFSCHFFFFVCVCVCEFIHYNVFNLFFLCVCVCEFIHCQFLAENKRFLGNLIATLVFMLERKMLSSLFFVFLANWLNFFIEP